MKVPTHISWSQVMTSLGEDSNPRYIKSRDRCDVYFPMTHLSKETLDQAASRIMGDIRAMLLAASRPALESTVLGKLPSETAELSQVLEATFPSFMKGTDKPDSVQMLVGGKIFNLQPVLSDDKEFRNSREDYEENVQMLQMTYEQMFGAYKREFDSRYDRLKKQIEENVTVPPSLNLTQMIDNDIIFFAKSRNAGDDRIRYWFSMPFKINQTKIRSGKKIERLKKKYWIQEEGFFTVAYQGNGQECNRNLTVDRKMSNALYHNHSLSGLQFCSGSYSRPILDLTRNVLDQVIFYRNEMQDLLEIVNPSSWGTNRRGKAADLRSGYDTSGIDSVIMTKTNQKKVKAKDIDSDTGRGIGDVWELTSEEVASSRASR